MASSLYLTNLDQTKAMLRVVTDIVLAEGLAQSLDEVKKSGSAAGKALEILANQLAREEESISQIIYPVVKQHIKDFGLTTGPWVIRRYLGWIAGNCRICDQLGSLGVGKTNHIPDWPGNPENAADQFVVLVFNPNGSRGFTFLHVDQFFERNYTREDNRIVSQNTIPAQHEILWAI